MLLVCLQIDGVREHDPCHVILTGRRWCCKRPFNERARVLVFKAPARAACKTNWLPLGTIELAATMALRQTATGCRTRKKDTAMCGISCANEPAGQSFRAQRVEQV